MDEEKTPQSQIDFDLLRELYPHEFEKFLADRDKDIAFYKKEMEVFKRFHDLIVEAAVISEHREWFIDTGSWLDIMDYMIDRPQSWLKHDRAVLRKLRKKKK